MQFPNVDGFFLYFYPSNPIFFNDCSDDPWFFYFKLIPGPLFFWYLFCKESKIDLLENLKSISLKKSGSPVSFLGEVFKIDLSEKMLKTKSKTLGNYCTFIYIWWNFESELVTLIKHMSCRCNNLDGCWFKCQNNWRLLQ